MLFRSLSRLRALALAAQAAAPDRQPRTRGRAAHNLAHAAKAHGAEFFFHKEVSGITKSGDKVTGVTLASGETISAPIVINAAGPHAAKINRLAGVYDEMKVHHQPLRQEVFSPPAPVGFRLEDNAPIVADLDLGQYFRPHMGDLLNVGKIGRAHV